MGGAGAGAGAATLCSLVLSYIFFIFESGHLLTLINLGYRVCTELRGVPPPYYSSGLHDLQVVCEPSLPLPGYMGGWVGLDGAIGGWVGGSAKVPARNANLNTPRITKQSPIPGNGIQPSMKLLGHRSALLFEGQLRLRRSPV